MNTQHDRDARDPVRVGHAVSEFGRGQQSARDFYRLMIEQGVIFPGDTFAQPPTAAVVMSTRIAHIVVNEVGEVFTTTTQERGNAPSVADRLRREFLDGTAAKDWDAWAREAVTTMGRLL